MGQIRDLKEPQKIAENAAGSRPQITGRVALSAKQIASAEASTEFKDLAVDLAFEGGLLRVNNFVVKTRVVVPRAAPREAKVRIAGSLPVSDPRQDASMILTAPKWFSPKRRCPGSSSGAIASEFGTDNSATLGQVGSLAITELS